MRGNEPSRGRAAEGADLRTRTALEKGLASAADALVEPTSPALRCYAEAVAEEVRAIARARRLQDLVLRAEVIIAEAEAVDQDDLDLLAPGV